MNFKNQDDSIGLLFKLILIKKRKIINDVQLGVRVLKYLVLEVISVVMRNFFLGNKINEK